MAGLYAYRLVPSDALAAGAEDAPAAPGTLAAYAPVRLQRQQRLVYDVMRDGKWWTLREISLLAGISEASVSARLRDFRKGLYGGSTVERTAVRGYYAP